MNNIKSSSILCRPYFCERLDEDVAEAIAIDIANPPHLQTYTFFFSWVPAWFRSSRQYRSNDFHSRN